MSGGGESVKAVDRVETTDGSKESSADGCEGTRTLLGGEKIAGEWSVT